MHEICFCTNIDLSADKNANNGESESYLQNLTIKCLKKYFLSDMIVNLKRVEFVFWVTRRHMYIKNCYKSQF